MEPLGVGLHIVYGRMGAGKTNFVVGEILPSTTYKKVITNIPLYEEFRTTLDSIEFTLFKKLEPEKCIRLIDEEHQDTLFLIDEAQMVLSAANKLLVNLFVKKMSQIRQNNQSVVIICQISKMLPKDIKDLAESCWFFENNNVKGVEKSSHGKRYRTGYDYTSRIIEEFTYIHKYGLYESTNTATTEKPQNLYRRAHIKLFLIFGVAGVLFIFAGYKFWGFFSSFRDSKQTNQEQTNQEQINHEQINHEQISNTLCVRSWAIDKHSIVFYILNDGSYNFSAATEFMQLKKCVLFNQTEQKKGVKK